MEQVIKGTQNSIEWVKFLSKNEIDAGEKNYHKCITIHEATTRLKDRFLRLYRDAVKALYGEGKYKLSGDYSPFLIPYREWMAKDDEFQKMEVFRRFLNEPLPPLTKIYISNEVTENISNSSNIIETTITPIEKQSINKIGISTDNIIVDSSRSEENEEKSLRPKEISIKYSALNLPEDIIPLQTVKAKELLNGKNGICKEASSHPRIFSVKRFSNDKKPHRVSPKGKNQNHLQCDCRIFAWYDFCCHTLAVSEYGGFCLDYLNELKKKIFQGKPNLTAAIDKTRKINEKGMEKNEIAKASKRRT